MLVSDLSFRGRLWLKLKSIVVGGMICWQVQNEKRTQAVTTGTTSGVIGRRATSVIYIYIGKDRQSEKKRGAPIDGKKKLDYVKEESPSLNDRHGRVVLQFPQSTSLTVVSIQLSESLGGKGSMVI